MNTGKNTANGTQEAANSSPAQTDALAALIGKLNRNPQAAEAMQQALAKTRAELAGDQTGD